MTKNPEVRFAKSIVDYIFRWMATKFLSPEAQFRVGVNMREDPADSGPGTREPGLGARDPGPGAGRVTVGSAPAASSGAAGRSFPGSTKLGTSEGGTPAESDAPKPRASEFAAMRNQEDAPPCSTCGSIMIRSGSCYKCANC